LNAVEKFRDNRLFMNRCRSLLLLAICLGSENVRREKHWSAMKNLTTRLAILLLSTLCLLTGAFAQFTPSQDSYIFSTRGGQNYGTAPTLQVESTLFSHAISNAYIQFDLSSIPSSYTGANVTKASLKLFVNYISGAGGSFNVDLANGSWKELGINYNNAPALGTTIASSIPLTTANVNHYVIVDVTSAVQAWLDGSQANDGIALVANNGLAVLFDSKENTQTSHPPELDIVFASGGGTITGVTTSNGSGLIGGGTTGNLNLSLTNACNIGQVLAWNGAGGGWVCSTVTGGGGGITGSGTVNSLPLFNGATSLTSSNVFQSGLNIGIGTATPQATLDVNGAVNTLNGFNVGGTPFAFGSSSAQNAFLGFAGNSTMTGEFNTAVGYSAFVKNVSGRNDTAVGTGALQFTTGSDNTGIGAAVLAVNSIGSINTAVGNFALLSNTTGNFNTGIGGSTLFGNTTGSVNTALGFQAGDLSLTGLNNATAIGAYADVTQSNSLVLGSIANLNGCDPNGTPACQNTMVGIGTTAPQATLDVEAPTGTTPTVNFGSASNPSKFTVNSITTNITGVTISETSGPSGIAINPAEVVLTSTLNQVNGPTIINGLTTITGLTTIAGGLIVTGGCTGCGGGGGGITGSGTANSLPLFATNTSVASSNVFQGLTGNIGIGTATPQATLDVNGNINLPNTTSSSMGMLSLGGSPFISNFPGTASAANTFVGTSAGNTTMTSGATQNTAVGTNALTTNAGGYNNTAMGAYPLHYNSSGNNNSAFGASALNLNAMGNNNSALGYAALQSNTSGNANSAVGNGALASNSTGGENTAIGVNALELLGSSTGTGGSSNIAIGYLAGNTFTGVESNNIDIGNPGVLGESNTIRIGDPTVQTAAYIAGNVNVANLTVTGTCNGCGGGGGGSGTVTSVAAGLGLVAKPNPITTSGTVAIDPSVVPRLAANNSFAGSNTFTGSTTAAAVTATSLSTTGLILAGSVSTFGTVGAASYTLEGTTILAHAPATGGSLLLGENTGNSALLSPNDFSSTTVIGDNAMSNYTSGSYNTALGNSALSQDQTGSSNTAAGYSALRENTSGSNNTALGYYAGMPSVFNNTTGSNNTFLGAASGPGAQLALNYATAIGAGAVVGAPNALALGGPAGSGADVSVGIGTATPQATLDVVGGANFSGTVNIANLNVTGTLSKPAGTFKIDHPLDPANKYLYHSFVESPDMMNVYNGNINTDGSGLATVTLPDWFEALNRDFRYQLTVIGQFAQAIVASEVSHNQFTIRTDRPNVKVSWQVTGIRQDAYANAHRVQVEEDKPPQDQGHHLHPELFGAAPEQAVGYHAPSPATQR
jgi:trimeric autotransporter adhesin